MSIPTPPPGAVEVVPSARHRVLVVDDQSLVGTRVRQTLSDEADMEVDRRPTAAWLAERCTPEDRGTIVVKRKGQGGSACLTRVPSDRRGFA